MIKCRGLRRESALDSLMQGCARRSFDSLRSLRMTTFFLMVDPGYAGSPTKKEREKSLSFGVNG
jgi:hypothetical protein